MAINQLKIKKALGSLLVLFFFCLLVLFSCKKKATDNTQALMLLYCIQPVSSYTDASPNFVRLNANGSIYAGLFRPLPTTSNVGPNEVTLSYSENGETFENRSNNNIGLIGGAVSYTFANDSLLYSVLGDWKVFSSTNGGKTWTNIYTEALPASVNFIISGGYSYININANGKGAKFPISSVSISKRFYDYTEDGGITWNRVTSDLIGNQTITNVDFKPNGDYFFSSVNYSANLSIDARNVLFAKGSELTKIQDLMGDTKRSISLPFQFLTNAIGYVIYGDKLWKTTNGGTNWQAVTTTFTGDLRLIQFESEMNGWMFGGIDSAQFFQTLDGGVTWTEIILPFRVSRRSVFSVNANKIAILVDKIIYTSKDLFKTYTTGNAGLKVLTTNGTNATRNPACIPYSL